MVEKIFAKYSELKAILTAFNNRGKTDPEKLIEEVKVNIKEFSEILEEVEENTGDPV